MKKPSTFAQRINHLRHIWLAALISGVLFVALFSAQYLRIFNEPPAQPAPLFAKAGFLSDRNTWKNIYQNNRKIGVAHSTLTRSESGYRLIESLTMRLNIMGMIQDITLETHGRLNVDYSLDSFDFTIDSGRFRFTAAGRISGDNLSVTTRSAGAVRQENIRLDRKIYLSAGLVDALTATDIDSTRPLHIDVFDPQTLSQQPVSIKWLGRERIDIMGATHDTRKFAFDFKGVTQIAWIAESGEILKEKGPIGITLEKTSRDDALNGLPIESSQDLTRVVSVPSNARFDNVESLVSLQIKIDNIPYETVELDGGRQSLRGKILTITREVLPNDLTPPDQGDIDTLSAQYLQASVFIQSDHPRIVNKVADIIDPSDTPWAKARKLTTWIRQHIDRRPVLSLPDALATFENRMGDCNEHAMLLAAMARAAGIPARLEAGLVYLNGRFYYHAWNALYLGGWITVDSLFDQMPADVTHIRLTSGAHKLPLNIMAVIGRINIQVLNHDQAFSPDQTIRQHSGG